jgi:hypothetical protein
MCTPFCQGCVSTSAEKKHGQVALCVQYTQVVETCILAQDWVGTC